MKSSSASILDPLYSVVPCGISENICSLPATNQYDEVLPRHYNITTDQRKGNLSWPSYSNSDLPQREGTAMQISNIKEPEDAVYRRFTSLINCSTFVPGVPNFLEKDSHQKTSLWIDSNNELIFQEESFTNCENIEKGGVELLKEENSHFTHVVNRMTHYHQDDDEENQSCSRAALQKDNVKLPTSEVPKCELLKCKSRPASKHVHFSEKETDIHHKIVKKVHSTPKTCKENIEISYYL